MEQLLLKLDDDNQQGPPVYSVSEINRLLKRYLEGEPLFQYLTIRGEISNFKHHTSGHMYFSLKDGQSNIRCVMFRGRNSSLRFTPSNGMEAYATGQITIYEAGGVYQLYVEYLEPRGVGDLHLAYEKLKDKLAKEGLFDDVHKRPLPFLPKTVGIVTSPTGAAIQDMLNILTRRMPGVNILVAPALVQGPEAPASIVGGLRALAKWGDVDLIIVGRGGGSLEDLWAFNDENVCRAIFSSPIPVISAVGHESDVTISDFAADLRAPTPSAAAELAVPLTTQLLYEVGQKQSRLEWAWRSYVEKSKDNLNNLERLIQGHNPLGVLRERQQRLDELEQRLINSQRKRLENHRRELELAMRNLDGLSPLQVVGRGYGIIAHSGGDELVLSTGDVEVGDELDIVVKDGTIGAKVESIKPKD